MELLPLSEQKMDFFVDDMLVYTFKPEAKTEAIWPYNQPFFILLNVAVGGNFGGHDVEDSIFPQQYIIDYIKVYE